MSQHEVELISDGDGIAVIGDQKAVERFLASEGLAGRDLGLPRMSKLMTAAGASGQTLAEVAQNSGQWVKITKKSALDLQKYPLMKGPTPGVRRAVLTDNGRSKGFLEVVKTPGKVGANPSLMTGAAGLMTQLAMQQAMDEITDYLARIDAKLDDVIRAQKDAVVSTMIGVGFDIDEAMTLRAHVGRVNEVTWSKVQSSSATIARTQAYALLQLDALAEKLEDKARISNLLDAAKEVEAKTQEWLAVLARCFQLQDAIAVLEIDRVLETAPDDLDGHRLGLRAARAERRDTIARSTCRLLDRMALAAATANQKVLLNPSQSPAIVQVNSHVTEVMTGFHDLLGIDDDYTSLEARRWSAAVADVRDRAQAMGFEGLGAAKRATSNARDRAVSVKGVATSLGDRMRRRDDGTTTDAD